MCGIAGWVASGAAAPPPDTLAEMLGALAHRGPDGSGAAHIQCRATRHEVALGHRRLAIIDPVGAPQPMRDTAAGLTLVFNGEIYNFRELRRTLALAGLRFERDSDTEVLLRAYERWGHGVVHRLRGMFAFAVWDERDESLFLARDRFGEKPLFIATRGDSLFFASEIKALLRVPGLDGGVDLDAVRSYFAYRYVPGPATLFAGVRKLPPGTTLVWRRGVAVQRRYWTAPDRAARDSTPCDGPPRPSADVVPEFRRRLTEAVQLTMVSDVPFGAFLSGGLDSSVIVALMSRLSGQVKTFTAGFADGTSELPHAAAVAREFGTDHHEVVVSHADVAARLASLVAKRDAPVSEPSDVALHLLATAAARSVKMVLTGEGSDEVLGGYPKHVAECFAPAVEWLPASVRRLLEPLVRALPYRFRRIKTAAASFTVSDRRERYVRWFGALDGAELVRLTALGAARHDLNAPPFDAEPGASALRQVLYFDQTSWLPDNLLERADRMTMAASIEARVPYLDHELAEFVSELPDEWRVRGLTTKRILRAAAADLLPRAIIARPKVGFRVPVDEWFRGPLREYLLDHLCGGASLTRGYYNGTALDALVAEHLSGKQNHDKLLWMLLNLEIWHRQYAPRIPATAALPLQRVA
jgi:asparagine synthase (glutamine-hydrolysing)